MLNYLHLAAQLPRDKPIIWSSGVNPGASPYFDETPIDYVVSVLLAHTAVGTVGAVHGTTSSQGCGYDEIIGNIRDLLPPQEYVTMPLTSQKGLPSVFKVRPVVYSRLLSRS